MTGELVLTAGETMARLGVGTRWLSKLGDDELGAAVRAALEAEGVDLHVTGITRAGHLIAAFALRGTGDWETPPRLYQVAEELGV